jgi:hypothetical protein
MSAPPLPPFAVGAIVPSMRDFLQAIRTKRTGLALVPWLSVVDAGREALRDVESGVTALAMSEPGLPMAEAAAATRVPMLCLRAVTAKDDYLAARAYGADAIVLSSSLDDAAHADLAKGSRSTRMMALDLATSETDVKRAVDAGTKGIVLQGGDAASVRALAAKVPSAVTLVAWPGRATEEDIRSLVGAVDATIVGVDIYGATGFERLVSELNP